MRNSSQLFFLAAFALLRPSYGSSGTKSHPSSPDTCAINPKAIVSDACTSYAALDAINADISSSLKDVTQNTDFFAYYRLNLFGSECPFWSDANSMCGNRACAVDTIDDERDIPQIWRAEELSKLEGARAKHPGRNLQNERPKARPLQYQLGENVDESCVLEDDDECDSRDYCVPEDEGATAKGDYVSLVNNTERFTGYSGTSARMVWDAIYSENCFTRAGAIRNIGGGLEAAQNLKSVIQEHSRAVSNPEDLYPLSDECLEQRAFYRIISGMHASISAHICWDYLNQSSGEWGPNITCYKERLHDHPERVANLYFNYALVTRAVAKLRGHFAKYTFCSGDPVQDLETKGKVLELTDRIASEPSTFDESTMFNGDMLALKDDFKHRFRNVSRLMDCVGCDKCRLWGKVQTAGYGAALKVLFEFDEGGAGSEMHLRRTEVVALVNTLGRLSDSLAAVNKFRVAVATGDEAVLGVEGWPFYAVDVDVDGEADSIMQKLAPDEDDLEDFDFTDLDDDPYTIPPNQTAHTIKEEIYSEFEAVWRAFKYVMNSWVSFPFQASAIAITEGQRLWNYWLGLPVGPRTWRIHLPGRDEL